MNSQVISEYDLVKVIELNSSVPDAEIGDIGAVLMLFYNGEEPVAYEVECVQKDGQSHGRYMYYKLHLRL